VAVTGSVARGNWHATSDVDLWVLGPRNAHIHITTSPRQRDHVLTTDYGSTRI
jgi:predicted nucleotidyltransferase